MYKAVSTPTNKSDQQFPRNVLTKTGSVYSTPVSVKSIAYFNNQQPIRQSRISPINTSTPYYITNPLSTNQHHAPFYSNVDFYEAAKEPLKTANQLPIPINDEDFVQSRVSSHQQIVKKQKRVEQDEKIKKYKQNGSSRLTQFLIATVIALFSLIVFSAYDSIIDSVLDMNMQFKEGGALTQNWQKAPIPLDACFYLWGLKNGKQFLRGAKPRIKEHGPFCYFENKIRTIHKWTEHSLTFTERYNFEFNEKASHSLDVQLRVLNYPLVFTILTVKAMLEQSFLGFISPVAIRTVALGLRATGEQVLETRTARELLEGRKIKMIEYMDVALTPLKAIGIDVPPMGAGMYKMHNATFGFMAQRLYTDFGPFEIFTKSENGHTFGDTIAFDDKKVLPGYEAPCNRISGGDGMFFGPKLKVRKLHIFNQHACRFLTLLRNKTWTHPKGFPVVRYVVDPHIFDMSIRDNRCYCLDKRPWQECDGWTDMSPCFGGIPMGLSLPHFLNAPRRQLDGLEPDPAKHLGYLDIEPKTGVPAGGHIGVQGVMGLSPISSVSDLATLPKVMLPIFWCNEGADLPGGMLVMMSIGVNSMRYGSYGALAGGLALSGLFFYRAVHKRGPK